MILPFSTKINGKPNYFIEKIWEGLFRNNFKDNDDTEFIMFLNHYEKKFGRSWDELPHDERLEFPKIHTIRRDDNNRWKHGKMIDFFINSRTKNMFRFAPRIPVISTQRIFMTYFQGRFEVSLDDRYLYWNDIEKIALNDGFDSFDDFRDYFISEMKDGSFSGKIIHWTNFRY